MIRLALLFVACGMAAALAAPASQALGQKKSFENGVKKIEGSFTPTEAKPGQTVTFSVTIELNEGYHTYPTVQADKGAEFFVNEIKFPSPGQLIFVGTLEDPKDLQTKLEDKVNLQYCTGKVVYTQKAVVSPKASAGSVTVKLPTFNINVCDDKNCFSPKNKPVVEATLKVLEGPPVAVEKNYVDEVKKALGEK
jgi:hypothetical protein